MAVESWLFLVSDYVLSFLVACAYREASQRLPHIFVKSPSLKFNTLSLLSISTGILTDTGFFWELIFPTLGLLSLKTFAIFRMT